jgi:hypothetical protein
MIPISLDSGIFPWMVVIGNLNVGSKPLLNLSDAYAAKCSEIFLEESRDG